ncbi:hypothetical protein BDF19DRAFT_468555 [Syncephalis fuscata]|nr:hypothetical protein BDF19DRAFT_468555 [Syncephalis fuscata]
MWFAAIRQNEPIQLIIARILAIILLTAVFINITVYQVKKAVDPIYIYQISESTGTIPVPTIIFYGPSISLSDVSIQVTADHIDATGVTGTDKNLTSALKKLRWGEDVIEILDTNFLSVRDLKENSNIWSFQPPLDWQFMPAGQFNISDTSGQKNVTEVRITITGSNNMLLPNRTENRGRIDLCLVEDPEALYSARRRHKPFDLSSVGGNLKTNVDWENKRKINFRYFKDHFKDERHVRYDVHSESEKGEKNVATIVLSVQNPTASDKRYFVYEIQDRQADFSWMDCISSIGGVFSLFLSVFAFLFGQGRISPWGAVQRYIFRNQVLGKFYRSVVRVAPTPILGERTATGHNSNFNRHETAHNSNARLDNRQQSPGVFSRLSANISNCNFSQIPEITNLLVNPPKHNSNFNRHKTAHNSNAHLNNRQQSSGVTNRLSANISNRNSSQIPATMNPPVNSPEHPMTGNNEASVREAMEPRSSVYPLQEANEPSSSRSNHSSNSESTNMRILRLESFCRRIELFYLSNDLSSHKYENKTLDR